MGWPASSLWLAAIGLVASCLENAPSAAPIAARNASVGSSTRGSQSLRGGIRGGAEMYAADREVWRVLLSMGQLDTEAVGGTVQRIDADRAAGTAKLARRLGEQGVLREGVTVEDAIHLLWLLTSFDSFDQLHTEKGLSVEEASRLLIAAAEGALYR